MAALFNRRLSMPVFSWLRPYRRTVVPAVVVLLVAAELWALTSPLLNLSSLGGYPGLSVRSTALVLDLVIVVPLLGAALLWALAPAGSRLVPPAGTWKSSPVFRFGRWALLFLAWRLLRSLDLGLHPLLLLGLLEAGFLIWAAVLLARLTPHVRQLLGYGYSPLIAIASVLGTRFGGVQFRLALRLALTELGLLYYGAIAWWLPRKTRSGYRNSRSDDSTVFAAVGIAVVLEMVPAHLLVQRWSPFTANILLALSIYTLLWIVGDIVSRLLRTHRFVNGKLRLVRGLRLEAVISPADISSIYLSGDPDAPEAQASFGEMPQFVLQLAMPVRVFGWFAAETKAEVVAVQADEPEALLDVLLERAAGECAALTSATRPVRF